MSLPESSSMAPRILLVVESAREARAVVGALRRAGWQPRCVRVAAPRSLTGALKNGVWDAVVIDCQLRRLDVVETIAAVLAGDGDMPVVAVSGAPAALAVETLRAGAVDYLLKTDLGRLPATLVRELRRAGERRELRATRAQLSESEERFRTLVEATNQIVWTAGPDSEPDGRIDDWTAFTGQSLEEFSGKGWLDAIHPDDRERADADWRRAASSGTSYESEYRLLKRGVGYRWMSSRAVPRRDASGAITQWIGADRDVTDQLRVARDLTIEKDSHARLMAISPAFFCAVGNDGRIVLVNQAMLDCLGYRLDDLVGTKFVDLLAATNGRAAVEADIWGRLGGNESITSEFRMVAADGREVLVEWRVAPVLTVDGELDYVAGVGIDVTERRGAEAALRDSEARFRALFDAAPLPYQSLDADGVVIAVNEAWLETFEYRRDDVVGRPFAELLVTADAARLRTALERLASGTRLETQFEMVRADGATVTVAFDGRLGLDVAGHSRQTHCILVDVTVRQRALAALQRSDDRYRTLTHTASSWVWTRQPDGALVEPYESFLEFAGTTADEVKGVQWPAVHPDDRDVVTATWAAAVGRVGVFKMELRMRRGDGAYEWFCVQGTPVVDEEGRLIEYVGTSVNVHERNLALEALRESEQRHQALFEQAPVGVFVFDRDLRVTACNAELARMMGVDPARLVGGSLRAVATDDVVATLEAALRGETGAYEGAFHVPDEHASLGADEHAALVVTMRVSPLRAADGSVNGGQGVVADVSERHRLFDRLDLLAFTDLVTGLPNRSAFDCRLHEAVGLAALNSHKVALAVLNVDRFKHIYDTRGGRAADRVLGAVGTRLTRLVGENGTVARAGGDEFLLLLPVVAGSAEMTTVCDRIAADFRSALEVDGEPVYVQLSMGVALCPDDAAEPDALMRDATVAMRRAKRDGGGAGRLYDLTLDSQFAERLALESELHRALENDELRVHFQPQISGPHGVVVGVEALVRWQHPVRGLLAPAAFIPLAEDTGLIVPMGEWVLEAACRQVKAWHDAGLAKPRLAVNLSARQLGDDKLLSKITRALKVSGLEARYLEVEITETAVMADAEQARATVGQITGLGVGVALDDFGTGYSSLSLLSSLPVGTVKIDRSFVAGMLEHDRDMTIVTSVIALGRRLGLNVVAEGVETREQFDALRRNGCDEMQGYLFGRPVAAAECEALLRRPGLLDGPAADDRRALRSR